MKYIFCLVKRNRLNIQDPKNGTVKFGQKIYKNGKIKM